MRKLMLICLSLAIAGGAWGQGKAKVRSWSLEPDSFIGVKFGEPFPTDIPQCFNDLVSKINATNICVDRGYQGLDLYTLYGLPSEIRFMGFPGVHLKNGVVSNFTVTTNVANYPQLKDMFIARYGKPTNTKIRSLQNRMGAKFNSESLEWLGKKVRINLYEHFDSIDTSMAFLTDIGIEKSQESAGSEAALKAASKL